MFAIASAWATLPTHRGTGIHVQKLENLIPFEGTMPVFFHLPSAPMNKTLYRSHAGHNCANLGLKGNSTCKGLNILQPFVKSAYEILGTLTATLLRQDRAMFSIKSETLSAELEALLREFGEIANLRKAKAEGTQCVPGVDGAKRCKKGFIAGVWENVFGIASMETVSKMRTDAEDIESFLEKVKKSVSAGHGELVSVEAELGGLSNDTAVSVHQMARVLGLLSYKIGERMNESRAARSHYDTYISQLTMLSADLLTMLHSHTLLASFQHIQTSCDTKRIPHAFIPPAVLKTTLLKARTKLRDQYRTLAIDVDNIDLYYRLPIVHCLQSLNTTLVRINVPFVQVDARWSVARVYPVPFGFGKATLYLDLPAQLVARNGREIRIFESLDENKCGGLYDFLCLLPVHTSAHIPSRDCLYTMLGSPTVGEVQKHCHYTQLNTTTAHVSPLPNGTFSVAHLPQGAMVKCLKVQKSEEPISNIPKWGNLEVQLPCNCILTANGRTLAENRFPCSVGLVNEVQLRTVIPSEWITDAKDLVHPVSGGVSLAMPNIAEEIMPYIRQLDKSAPRLVNITDHELGILDDRMDRANIVYKIHHWISATIPWGEVATWVFLLVHSGLILFLITEHVFRVRPAVMAAAAMMGTEAIPMTEAFHYGDSISCELPNGLEQAVYLILFLVIILVVYKLWSVFWNCVSFCFSCLTLSRVRRWLFATRRSHSVGARSNSHTRALSPEQESFVQVDETAPIYSTTTTNAGSGLYPNAATLPRMTEEVPTSANSLHRTSSSAGGPNPKNQNQARVATAPRLPFQI